MLALGVQEQSQLHLLESSLSNTVNHQWPILHAQIIDEGTSSQNRKEPATLTFTDQPGAHFSSTVEIIRVPETNSYGSQHFKGPYHFKSDVMLGTLERVSPMEVSATTEKMVLHKSEETSAAQDSGDFLEGTIHPELSSDQHKNDDQPVSEPTSEPLLPDGAADTEDQDINAGLHSEQNGGLSGLLLEKPMSPSTNKQHANGLTDEECNLSMLSEDTSPHLNTRNEDSGQCLDHEVPLLSSTSSNLPRECLDTSVEPVWHKETSGSEELEPSEILKSSEGTGLSKDPKTPQGKALENVMPSVMESSNTDAQAETFCEESQSKKCPKFAQLLCTNKGETLEMSLGDLQSQAIPKDLLLLGEQEVQVTEVPRLSSSFKHQFGANSSAAPDCFSLPFTNKDEDSLVFPTNHTCANKLQNCDHSLDTNSMEWGPSISDFGELSCECSTYHLSEDQKYLSVEEKDSVREESVTPAETCVTGSSHGSMVTQEMDFMQNHFPPVATGRGVEVVFVTNQTLEDNMPAAGSNAIFSCTMVTNVSLHPSTEIEDTYGLQTGIAEIEPNSDNLHNISKLDHTLLSSGNQSLNLDEKETTFSLEDKDKMPLQAPADHIFHELNNVALPLEASASNALVPYVNIWSFLTKPKATSAWVSKHPKNIIIKKAKCQMLRESRILYTKGKILPFSMSENSHERRIFVRFSGLLNFFTSPLTSPKVEYKILKKLFHDLSAGWPSRKIKDGGVSAIVPAIFKTESACQSILESVISNNLSLIPINTQGRKEKCYMQKQDISQSLTSSSKHNMTRFGLPEPTLSSSFTASCMKHTNAIKVVNTRGSKEKQCSPKDLSQPTLLRNPNMTGTDLLEPSRSSFTASNLKRTNAIKVVNTRGSKEKRYSQKDLSQPLKLFKTPNVTDLPEPTSMSSRSVTNLKRTDVINVLNSNGSKKRCYSQKPDVSRPSTLSSNPNLTRTDLPEPTSRSSFAASNMKSADAINVLNSNGSKKKCYSQKPDVSRPSTLSSNPNITGTELPEPTSRSSFTASNMKRTEAINVLNIRGSKEKCNSQKQEISQPSTLSTNPNRTGTNLPEPKSRSSFTSNMKHTDAINVLNLNVSTEKSYSQKPDISQPLIVSSNPVVTGTDLPEPTRSSFIVSNVKRTNAMNVFSPVQTRSRRRTINIGSSAYCTSKPALPSMPPKELRLNIQTDADEHRLAFAVQKAQSRRKSMLESSAGPAKCKRVCIKTEKMIPDVEIDNAQPSLDKPFQNELPTDCLGKTTTCQGLKRVRTSKCKESCVLKLETQSLNSFTTQGAKRPKICKRNGQPVMSDIGSGIDAASSTRNINPPAPRPSSIVKNVQIAPNESPAGCEIPLKIQPFRKCKNPPLPQKINVNPKMQACEVSSHFPAHASLITNHKSLQSRHVLANVASNPPYVKKRGTFTLHVKHDPEQALLHKLSSIANRLTAPPQGSLMSKASYSATKVVPFRGVQLQARKLLKVFSCVNMKISSLSSGSVPISSRDHLVSQSMDLFPTHLKICSNDLAQQFPLTAFNNSTFPVSFHMKVDPSCLADFITFNPPDYMFKNALPVTQSSQLPEWTLSVFLSPQFPASQDNVQLFTQWNPNFRCLDSSRSVSNYKSFSKRGSGCSMLGLHTILALSSPGCYRLWTRKRNLGSRIPTVQKLSVMQFAHGLKGLAPGLPQEQGTSSLAFSLGRVLSMWSRHGFSAFSLDSNTQHPHCQLWQPGQSINIRSPDARLCTAPNPSLEVSRWDSFSLPSLNLPLDLPKNCLGANAQSFLFSLSPRQKIKCGPSSSLPVLSNPVNALSPTKNVGLWHYTRATEHGNHITPIHSVTAKQEEPLLYLCTEKSSLKPRSPVPCKHGGDFGPQSPLFKELSVALRTPDLSSCKQNHGIDPLHCLSTEQNHSLEPVGILAAPDYIIGPDNVLAAKKVGLQPNCFPGDCHRPRSSFSEKITIEPLHFLSAQCGPRFSHGLPTKSQGNSQLLSSRQDNHLEPPCFSPQEIDPGPQPSLSAHRELCRGTPLYPSIQANCTFGQTLYSFSKQGSNPRILHNLFSQQDGDFGSIKNLSTFQGSDPKPPCLLPIKVSEETEDVSVLHAKAEHPIQVNEKQEVDRKPQRVSQIKIRKTVPKPDPNLTPMGLPKPKRINKKEFTLEDIYTNKNYKCPPPARSLETIFEEPKEKNGVLVSVSQTRRKRILEFRDCTLPRPKRAKGKVRVMASCKRGRKAAATEGVELDALLIQKLMDLENFLLEQEALEKGSAPTAVLS